VVLLQVATDTRLWLFASLTEVRGSLQELITVATNRAEAEADVLMPGA
jgi:argininosuccinate lyase